MRSKVEVLTYVECDCVVPGWGHILVGALWSNGGMIISIKEKGKEGKYGENPLKFRDSKQEFPKPHN